jgi:hypothetical protein
VCCKELDRRLYLPSLVYLETHVCLCSSEHSALFPNTGTVSTAWYCTVRYYAASKMVHAACTGKAVCAWPLRLLMFGNIQGTRRAAWYAVDTLGLSGDRCSRLYNLRTCAETEQLCTCCETAQHRAVRYCTVQYRYQGRHRLPSLAIHPLVCVLWLLPACPPAYVHSSQKPAWLSAFLTHLPPPH